LLFLGRHRKQWHYSQSHNIVFFLQKNFLQQKLKATFVTIHYLNTKMIQRIQTVYLLLAVILSGGLVFLVSLWTLENNETVKILDTLLNERFLIKSIGISFFVSSLLSVYSVFCFKNRKRQFVLGRLNILINFYLLGLLLMQSLNLSGETSVSEKGIGIFIPLVVIVFLVMANKAIKKDEALVKSVDRLR